MNLSEVIKKSLSKFILYGLPLFYLLVAVSFYLVTYDSAQIKITIVQIGGILFASFWLMLKLETGSFDKFKNHFFVYLPIILFFISGLVSLYISPFFQISLNEFFRRLIYCFLAIIIMDTFNDEKSINRLINFLIVATYISCIYAIIQHIDYKFFPAPPSKGLDPFVWRGVFHERVFSTFGNPNFFGDFLVVMGPIVLALFFKSKKFHLLFLWFLIAFSIYFTYSKGAWLGFGIGLLMFSFLFVNYITNMEKKKRLTIIAVMAVLTISIVFCGIFVQLKKRIDSSSFRIFTWNSCWEMINTHPIIGTGIGTFYVTYPAYRRPQIFFIEGAHNTESDHPENEYLEVFYDEGLIGFGIFLTLVFTFIMLGFKNLAYFRRRKNQQNSFAYLQLGVLSALIAQLGHNMVCVSLRFVSSGVMLWMLIGLIGAINFYYFKDKDIKWNIKFNVVLKRICQIIILAIAGYLIYIFCGFFQADKMHSAAILYAKNARFDQSIELFGRTIKKNPSFIMPRYFRANNYSDRWKGDDPEKALEEYKKLWKLAPNYVQSKFLVGVIYLKAWISFNSQANEFHKKGDKENEQKAIQNRENCFALAVKYFNEYKQIDPIYPETYYRLAWLYLQYGKYQQALNEYLAHLNFPEKLKEKPYNLYYEDWQKRRPQDYARTYLNIGSLFFSINDFDKAETALLKALELKPNNIDVLKLLVNVYAKKNDKQKYNKTLETLKNLYPNDSYVKTLNPLN